MGQFIRYWYLESPARFYAAFLAVCQMFEDTLAVKDTIRNITKPLFQDYTYQGRLIGFMLRLARIGLGVFIFTLLGFAYLFLFVGWILFPILCLLSLVGSIFGPNHLLISSQP